jgi:hypothetical protein
MALDPQIGAARRTDRRKRELGRWLHVGHYVRALAPDALGPDWAQGQLPSANRLLSISPQDLKEDPHRLLGVSLSQKPADNPRHPGDQRSPMSPPRASDPRPRVTAAGVADPGRCHQPRRIGTLASCGLRARQSVGSKGHGSRSVLGIVGHRLARLHRNLHGVLWGVAVVAAVYAAGQLKMAREQAEDAR